MLIGKLFQLAYVGIDMVRVNSRFITNKDMFRIIQSATNLTCKIVPDPINKDLMTIDLPFIFIGTITIYHSIFGMST